MYMFLFVFCFFGIVFLQLTVVWHLLSFHTFRMYKVIHSVVRGTNDALNMIMYKVVLNKHEDIFAGVHWNCVGVWSKSCLGY
jgi:hypothetical protein